MDIKDIMAKRKNKDLANFGTKLASLRKAAGYTQVELANELGISRRMIAYYERQSEHPPANLLPSLAKVLDITTDELLGVKPIKKEIKVGSSRLQRRFQQIEKLSSKDKKQISQYLDTFIEREQLKKKAGDK